MQDAPRQPHWPDCHWVEVCFQIHEAVYERYRLDPSLEHQHDWVVALQAVSDAVVAWRRRQDALPWPQGPPDK